MNRYIFKIVRALGYELIHKRKQPSLAPHLINLFRRYQINTVLDVGAHHGQFSKELRENGYKGVIHSFEPVEQAYKKLAHISAGDPQWHVHKLALGEEITNREINVVGDGSTLSSFLPASDFGRNYINSLSTPETELVHITTIDEFIHNSHLDDKQTKIFLKMDTQGYDLKVFRGAVSSLEKIIGILSELSMKPLYQGMPMYRDVLQEYENHGYKITGMYPVIRDKDFNVIEMDCVLIRTNKD